jgi:hypothetical protein
MNGVENAALKGRSSTVQEMFVEAEGLAFYLGRYGSKLSRYVPFIDLIFDLNVIIWRFLPRLSNLQTNQGSKPKGAFLPSADV